MSKPYEKKGNYRPKNEENRGRFGFDYNPDYINYRTQIPAIPEKLKVRPDEKIKEKKVKEMEEKYDALKKERKEKKDLIRKVTQGYDDQIRELKSKGELGEKCRAVLQFDIQDIDYELTTIKELLEEKNQIVRKLIDNLSKEKHVEKWKRKTYEEMTNKELQNQKNRLEQEMSRKALTKKEEAQFNTLLVKIDRIKNKPNRQLPEEPVKENHEQVKKMEEQLSLNRNQIQKLRHTQKNLNKDRYFSEEKIKCISEDLAEFIKEVEEIADKESQHEDAGKYRDESKALKQKIYQSRSEIAKFEEDFKQKINDFEYEQEKIKWIKWASTIQEKLKEEWEKEKEERRRRKAKGQKDKKEGQSSTNPQSKPEERKKINRNQKQIDNVAFLIGYCKELYPKNHSFNNEKKDVNVKEQLKKGPWAREKGLEILESKKTKKDEEFVPKYTKKKQAPKEEEVVPNRFSHTYFVAQAFDAAKLLPPASVEELDNTIKNLQDKLEYYLNNPDEAVQKKFAQDKRYTQRQVTDRKDGKAKPNNNLKVINTEDFPSIN